MKSKIFAWISSIILLTNIGLAGCGNTPIEPTVTPIPTPVRKTFTVQRGDIIINVELFGRVTALALEAVYFQMDGHVGDVYVQVNEPVKKGQLLADLSELKSLQEQMINTTHTVKRAQINLEIARLELEKLISLGASTFDIQIQEKQVELAQMDMDETLLGLGIDPSTAVLDSLDLNVKKARVYAPSDGVIISAVNPGRAIVTTTAAFTIGDGSQNEILASIDPGKGEETLKNLFEGMPVSVVPNSRPDQKLKGTIRLLPSPYGTGNSDDKNVHIILEQGQDSTTMKIGDTVTIMVELANKSGILWLNPAAIRQVGGRTFVIVIGDNGPKRMDIEIGLQTLGRVEITSGLSEGQEVISQ